MDQASAPGGFTSPGIGVAGLNEAEATAAGHVYESPVLPLSRAVVDRLFADRHIERLLGVHAVAGAAGEVAAGGWLQAAGVAVDQLATSWVPYLTTAEALKLTAQALPATWPGCPAAPPKTA